MLMTLERCANSFASSQSSTAYRESAMYHPERGISACIQVPIRCPRVQLPPTKLLWVEAVDSANDALNHTATPANPGNKSPHGMWYGTAAHASVQTPERRDAHATRYDFGSSSASFIRQSGNLVGSPPAYCAACSHGMCCLHHSVRSHGSARRSRRSLQNLLTIIQSCHLRSNLARSSTGSSRGRGYAVRG